MWLRRLCSLIGLTLVLTGCGGGSSHSPTSTGGGASNGLTTGAASTTTAGGSTGHASGPDNGVASRTAEQIVTAAGRAIGAARSVHVVGSVVDNGIPVGLNLHLSAHQGGEGEVSENGLGFRMISTGKVLYIQGSDAFWQHFGGARAAKVFHRKWLKVPDAGQFGTLGRLATIPGLVGQLLDQHGRLVRRGRTAVAGSPAVGVTDRTKGGTLYVATSGPPFPLEIVKRGRDGGYVKFTDFNQPVAISPPAKSIALPSSAAGQ